VATFPPFVAHILGELDALIDAYGLRGPFLDAACGSGYAAAHLARRGWTGVALDAAPEAVALTRARLRHFPQVEAVGGQLETYDGGPFATVLLFDVLEHLEDDAAALRRVAALQPAGGSLALTVPTHEAREWRWDDDVYGHLRRYDPDGLAALLDRAGYATLAMWDVTFPVFWLLRRAYTALKRPPPAPASTRERTARSGAAKAWDLGLISTALSLPLAWRPLLAWQRRFRGRIDAGHEVIALGRRTGGPR
jgi:SAM-dependent methyltransferase